MRLVIVGKQQNNHILVRQVIADTVLGYWWQKKPVNLGKWMWPTEIRCEVKKNSARDNTDTVSDGATHRSDKALK